MSETMYVDYRAKAGHGSGKKKASKKKYSPGASFLENMMAKSRKSAEKKYWEEREERRRRMQRQLAEAYAKRAMWKRVLDMEQSQAIHENEMISRQADGIPAQSGYVDTELNQAYGMYARYAMVSVAARKMRS